MRKIQLVSEILLLCFLSPAAFTQSTDSVFLFSYFKGNGEDGLHLAWSRDGFQWEALNGDSALLQPAVGNEKLMRDPCIIKGNDGYFHMVWSASWKDRGIGYARSKNLLNWSPQQFIPVMKDEPGALNCWAPEITYDAKKREYLIYWATAIPGRFPDTDTTGDDNYNHRLYYVVTKDFLSFSKAHLLYDKGFNVIDATIVPYNNEFWMFLKDETKKPPQKNIRIAKALNATGPYSAASGPVTDSSYWAEGPTVTRIDNKWVVYFDKYMVQQMGAIESTDGVHWTEISKKLRFPEGTRHGTILRVTVAQWNRLLDALRDRNKGM